MGILELFIIAVGLSMDAFAVSICKGLSMRELKWKNALIMGLYFGIFQAVMPLIGYFVGIQFADVVESVDHWIAFVLLAIIGGKMVKESREKDDCEAEKCEVSLGFKVMLPLAVATSIDALAVGVSFAFLQVQILPAALFIGCTTLVFSIAGGWIGKVFGVKFKSKAELAGGLILILMGLKILLEHLGVLG